MITIYIDCDNTSCKNALRWLNKYHVSYRVRNISHDPLSYKDIKNIFYHSIYGSESLISHRSRFYKNLTRTKHINLNDLSLSGLITLMTKHQSLLRLPVMYNDRQFQCGFNANKIRQFLPKSYKDAELKKMERLV